MFIELQQLLHFHFIPGNAPTTSDQYRRMYTEAPVLDAEGDPAARVTKSCGRSSSSSEPGRSAS